MFDAPSLIKDAIFLLAIIALLRILRRAKKSLAKIAHQKNPNGFLYKILARGVDESTQFDFGSAFRKSYQNVLQSQASQMNAYLQVSRDGVADIIISLPDWPFKLVASKILQPLYENDIDRGIKITISSMHEKSLEEMRTSLQPLCDAGLLYYWDSYLCFNHTILFDIRSDNEVVTRIATEMTKRESLRNMPHIQWLPPTPPS